MGRDVLSGPSEEAAHPGGGKANSRKQIFSVSSRQSPESRSGLQFVFAILPVRAEDALDYIHASLRALASLSEELVPLSPVAPEMPTLTDSDLLPDFRSR